ncbi:hypothetical protein PMAYCL1PPCAC_29329, partial [Pristionchus mayeri]
NQMDIRKTKNGEEKKRRARPKLHMDDLATRIMKSNAGEDYQEVCIKNVFDRIKFQSVHMKKPVIPNADITSSLPSKLVENLNNMGVTQLLPTQRYTLPLLLNHDTDVFVGAATGHGKTLAFLIPVAAYLLGNSRDDSPHRRPSVLVIANTQVLQVQTYRVCTSLVAGTGVRAVLVCGEAGVEDQKREIREGVDILIATTGRLLQFLHEGVLSIDNLKFFIYDEADKMTQTGAFREEVTKIDAFIPPSTKSELRSCFFTATLDGITAFDDMYRRDKYCMIRVPGNPLITHQMIPLQATHDNEHEKSLILMRLLQKDVMMQGRTLFDKSSALYQHKTIVFVALKMRCSFLAAYLRKYGFSVGVANSDLSLKMRNDIIERFSKGEIQALIATDSMARGHDIPNVTHVINYDIGDNALDTFKHRAGRTARIGHKGTCTTLLSRRHFLLFDDPCISDLDPARQRAAQLARYLVVECGQRIPRCLVHPARIGLRSELQSLGIEAHLDALLLEVTQFFLDDANLSGWNEGERPSLNEERGGVKAAKVGQLDEDGTPCFDASETERESDDSDEDEDSGGVTIDESEWDESDFYAGYPADSDSDAPKANESSETIVEDAGMEMKMRWTDDEEEGNEADRIVAPKEEKKDEESEEEKMDSDDEEDQKEKNELNDDEVD